MKITKKLRDVTKEEFKKWIENNCKKCETCEDCIFVAVDCFGTSKTNWTMHKEIFNDSFLNQTIEIEMPEILDKKEKEYLSAVIKPFRDKVTNIKKEFWATPKRKYIVIEYREDKGDRILVSLCFPDLPNDEMYKGMEDNRPYTLEELGL